MRWRVPFFDLKLTKSEVESVMRILEKGWLSEGRQTRSFERALEEYLGGGHVVATSSATAALYLALLALGIGPRDRVIVPSLSFVACANVVVRLGGVPVFVDIASAEQPVIDPSEVERHAASARFVMPVHYGGYPAPMREIRDIARAHDMLVVEDAAHALGARLGRRSLGTLGDAGCFSFYANKNLGVGEGGAVWCRTKGLADKVRTLKNHGITRSTWERHARGTGEYDVLAAGLNFRMDEVKAALGCALLKRYESRQARRQKLVERYMRNLSNIKRLTVPFGKAAGESAHHLFVVLFEDSKARDMVRRRLERSGVQTSIHYRPIHTFSFYAQKRWKLPKTEEFFSRALSLPLYPTLGLSQVDMICEIIGEMLPKRSGG